MVLVHCLNCGKEFSTFPSKIKDGRGKFCSLECLGAWNSEYMRGENCYFWKGGITPVITMVRVSPKYNQWRSEVFLRDNFICQKCGARGGRLHAHHKKSFSVLFQEAINCMPLFDPYIACLLYSPLWDVSNGVTLCEKCHKKTKSYLAGKNQTKSNKRKNNVGKKN